MRDITPGQIIGGMLMFLGVVLIILFFVGWHQNWYVGKLPDLQPTPPTQIAFTRCETGDTVWISSEIILSAKIQKRDSCYHIQKIYECFEVVKESPFDLLKQGSAK